MLPTVSAIYQSDSDTSVKSIKQSIHFVAFYYFLMFFLIFFFQFLQWLLEWIINYVRAKMRKSMEKLKRFKHQFHIRQLLAIIIINITPLRYLLLWSFWLYLYSFSSQYLFKIEFLIFITSLQPTVKKKVNQLQSANLCITSALLWELLRFFETQKQLIEKVKINIWINFKAFLAKMLALCPRCTP